MSDNQLHSLLENLFDGLDVDVLTPAVAEPAEQPGVAGWTFACDGEGRYVSCSPEIEAVLGYAPGELIGELFLGFALPETEIAALKELLAQDRLPAELDLNFRSRLGNLVRVNLQIFKTPSQNGVPQGWQGFAQVIDAPADAGREEPPATDSEPVPPPVPQDVVPKPKARELQEPEHPPVVPDEPPEPPPGISPTSDLTSFEDAADRAIDALRADPSGDEEPESPGEAPVARKEPPLPDTAPLEETVTTDRRVEFGTGLLRLEPAFAKPGSENTPAVLSVPVKMPDRSTGMLEIIDETPHRDWTEDERRLAEDIADQLSLALENAHLFAQTQKALDETETQAERLTALNEMSEQLSRATKLEEVFRISAVETANIVPAGQVSVTMIEPGRAELQIIALHGDRGGLTVGETIPLEGSAVGVAIREHRLVNFRESQYTGIGNSPSFLVAPLLASGRVLGTINVGHQDPDFYTSRDENLLMQVASLLASTIEGRRLFRRTEVALSETEALFQAGAELNSVQDYDQILAILRRYTVLGEGARHVTLALYDRPWIGEDIPDWQFSIAEWSADERPKLTARRRLHGWTNLVKILDQNAPTLIYDVPNDPRLDAEDLADFVELLDAQTAIFVPLNVGGQWIGHIVASYPDPKRIADARTRRLMSLAGQAAVAIENIRLLEETRRRARQLQTAAEIARDASETLAVEELLNRAVKLIHDRFGFYHVSIYLLEPDEGTAVMRAAAGKAGEELVRNTHGLQVGSRSVIGYVTKTGPLVLNDVSQEPLHQPNPLLPETRAELAIPLKVAERSIGALDVHSTQVNPFSRDDVAVLQTLADQIAVAVDNAGSYELAQNAFQQARQRLQELTMLYSISQSFASAPLEIEEIANIIARQFVRVLGVPECSVATLGANGTTLTTLVDIHVEAGQEFLDLEKVGRVYSLSDYPSIAEALHTKEPQVVHLSLDTGSLAKIVRRHEEDYARLVIIPMAAKGQSIGVIELKTSDETKLASPDELNLAITLANQAAVALENASLYQEQRITAERLRELDILKSQFLANMSHELRTPLNSIIGFSRVILKGIDGPVTDLQQQDLTAIYNAGQHLLGLINDILDLSKIEAGKMELSFEEIDLAELITSVMSTATGLVKHKSIHLQKEVADPLPSVYADPLRIRQVLLNLLSNAAKFTEQGTISVEAFAEKGITDGGEVIVRVKDTGPGISVEDQNKLFMPFSQVDSSPTRKSGGSGLGLSISRHLVEMHGGRIGVESEIGVGSTFFITLPVSDGNQRPEVKTGFLPRLPDVETESSDALDSEPFAAPDFLESAIPVEPVEDEAPENLPAAFEQAFASHAPEIDLDSSSIDGQGSTALPAEFEIPDIELPDLDVSDREEEETWPGDYGLAEEADEDEEPEALAAESVAIDEEEFPAFATQSMFLEADEIEEEIPDFALQSRRLDQEPGTHVSETSKKKILSIDQDIKIVGLYQRYLEDTDFEVIPVTDPRGAVEKAREIQPAVVTLDIMIPGHNGWQILEDLKSTPETRDIPVIICSIVEELEKAFSMGASGYLVKPILEQDLIDAVERIPKDGERVELHADGGAEAEDEPLDILIVDRDAADLKLLKILLEENGAHRTILAESGKKALETLLLTQPDAIIMNFELPDMDIFTFLKTLRANPLMREIPVIVLTEADIAPEAKQQLSRNSQAIYDKEQINKEELLSSLRRLRRT